MSERNRRGGRREHQSYRSREASDRQFGRDEPWREERRTRYPDEPYGGEREGRYASGGTRGYQDREYDDRGRRPSSEYGHGYGYGFSDSSRYRPTEQPGRRTENYGNQWERERDPSREVDDRWNRDRFSGGFGSEFGAWRSGASFGFGQEEDPRHETDWQGSPYGQGDLNSERPRQGFEDTDWIPNRPARGRGVWAGDWSSGFESPGRPGGFPYSREDYSGRGPKDYRRSDERIREEVCDRLTDDPSIDASDLTIRVEAGEVTLAGSIGSRDQKRRAEESAERISGVRDVINQIRVNRGDEHSQPQQTQQSQQASRSQRSSSSPQQSGIAADREK